jgi:hypothetical protein
MKGSIDSGAGCMGSGESGGRYADRQRLAVVTCFMSGILDSVTNLIVMRPILAHHVKLIEITCSLISSAYSCSCFGCYIAIA